MITNTENCSDETFVYCASSTSSLTVKMNLTNILFSVSLTLPISFSQILHPRGFSLFWAPKRMRSMKHMISSQNLTKSVSKTAKMPSGRRLRGMHMSCIIIFTVKNVTRGLNLLDATTAKYDPSCAKRRCIFMQRTNLLCKKILMCVKYYLENLYSLLCYIIMFSY